MHTSPAPHTLPTPAGLPLADRALARVAQALLIGPLGALVVFGSVYFGAIEPQETLGALDWVVGLWALAMGVASIALGARLVSGGEQVARLALRLVGLHVVFGVVKIVFYAEVEALSFTAVDVLVAAILLRLLARRGA